MTNQRHPPDQPGPPGPPDHLEQPEQRRLHAESPAPAEPPPSGRPALWLAGVLLLVIVFVAGLLVGQSGMLAMPGIGLAPPTPTPTHTASPPPTAESPPTVSPTPALTPSQPTDTPGPRTATPSVPPASPPPTPAEPVFSPPPIVTPAPGSTAGPPDDELQNFGLFWEALEIIRQNFVGRDEVEDRELTYGAIRGLVDALGDTGHSVFLTPEQLQAEQQSLSGTIVGVGALLGERGGRPVIVSVISGGPAQRAGLRSGDAFVSVDGVDVQQMPPEEIAARVRGEEGTTVVIVVDRPASGERLEFSIVREQIRIPTATWTMVPGTDIALLRLIQFSDGASEQLQAALDETLARGAESLILDLRSNPGGFVHEAVRVTSLFLDDRTVYIRELADGQRIPVETEDSLPATDLPLVVLIDQGTASSAEIVSGALRSAGRAELVGTTTFGTGTVLLTYELSDGSAVRIAVERWLTPDGELIFNRGIEPTVEVALEPDQNPVEPDELRDLAPADVPSIGDPQLLRAIELLGGTGTGEPAAAGYSGARSSGR